jgi:hypothetical protein
MKIMVSYSAVDVVLVVLRLPFGLDWTSHLAVEGPGSHTHWLWPMRRRAMQACLDGAAPPSVQVQQHLRSM